MEELEKDKNKIKEEARQGRNQSVNNIKREIEQNYEIGIEYFMNLEEYENLKDSN